MKGLLTFTYDNNSSFIGLWLYLLAYALSEFHTWKGTSTVLYLFTHLSLYHLTGRGMTKFPMDPLLNVLLDCVSHNNSLIVISMLSSILND